MKDGGPAFTQRLIQTNPNGVITDRVEGGMTLRDYFAAAVMQGMIASMSSSSVVDVAARRGERFNEGMADAAYILAEEMIKRRERQ